MEYSRAIKFGFGVFETIYYDGELEDFQLHMNRLNKSLRFLGMTPVSIDDVKKSALEQLSNTGDKAIRISVYSATPQTITYETRPLVSKRSYRVSYSKISRHSSNPLLSIKTSAHLTYYLEKQEASRAGIDEYLHFNEYHFLTEGIYTNVFFVKEGILYTPDASCGLLQGIYREKVIETAKLLGITVKIGYYKRECIEAADEVFLTNALIKIMPVFELDTLQLKKENVVTQQLMKEML